MLLVTSLENTQDLKREIEQGDSAQLKDLALAEALDAEIMDCVRARAVMGGLGKVVTRVFGSGPVLALACFKQRRRHRLILTMGESSGIPLAFLFKIFAPRSRPRHIMIGHLLSNWKKRPFFTLLRLQNQIDVFLVYASFQKTYLENRWGISGHRVFVIPGGIDTSYFNITRGREREAAQPSVLSVGLESRDYRTLLSAAAGLDTRVVIKASSIWCRRSSGIDAIPIPDNVDFVTRSFGYDEFRDLYASALVVVIPLQHVEYAAGLMAITEAMSMGKPIVCSAVPGQTDAVVDGVTGLYVPPGDAEALRAAIERLLSNPAMREKMGREGRQRAETLLGIHSFTAIILSVVERELGSRPELGGS